VAARKRANPSGGVGNDDDDSGAVARLERQVRELEARNEALERGAVASARMQQLADDAHAAQRAVRQLEAELDKTRRLLETKMEEVSAGLEMRKRYEASVKQVHALSEKAAEYEAMAHECAEWRKAVACSTPMQGARVVADLQRTAGVLKIRLGEAEAAVVLAQSQREQAQAHADELQAALQSAHEDKASLTAQLQTSERKTAQAAAERDAAERVMALGDAPGGVDERVAQLASALESARNEAKALKAALERSENAAPPQPPTTASAPAASRILHVKPSARADRPKPVASATQEMAATPFAASALDDHMRSQRLKEVFQRQMQSYKDLVYVLTGFKIDMTPEAIPKVRVRCMYAESPNDFLSFTFVPDTSALEMLSTEYTKTLDEHVMAYLRRCDSMPAFMASLCLSLFERQTMRG